MIIGPRPVSRAGQVLLLAIFVFPVFGALAQESGTNTAAPVLASNSTPNVQALDSIRLLFDSRGGFKPFRIAAEDGTRHALLNPETDQPVSMTVIRNGAILPMLNTPILPPKDGDPGYRGPALEAQDIRVQLWGLDIGKELNNWSALRYEFSNSGNTITTISVRFVFDTWLSETSKDHLSLLAVNGSEKKAISDETRVFLQEYGQLLGSQKASSADGFWLLVPPGKNDSIAPSRLVVANVRRLQNSDILYELEDHRAFNLLPFSVNDSAIGLFYDALTILPRQKIAIDIVFSTQPDTDQNRVANLRSKLRSIRPSIDTAGNPTGPEKTPKRALRNAEQLSKLEALILRLNGILSEKNYRAGEVEILLQSIAEIRKSLQTQH